jgi:hypothetical protein
VFSHKLTEDTGLRLLEERHAEELTNLTDRNRKYPPERVEGEFRELRPYGVLGSAAR